MGYDKSATRTSCIPSNHRQEKHQPVIALIVVSIAILGLVVVGGVVWWVGSLVHRNSENAAMIEVVNRHHDIQLQLNGQLQSNKRNLANTASVFKKAVASWKQIDTERCPDDFRMAYQRYLSTCDQVVQDFSTVIGMAGSKSATDRMQRLGAKWKQQLSATALKSHLCNSRLSR